jgi:NAD+ diphosphatase
MAPPELPVSPYSDIDSLLSRKFGREVVNYFSGSPLNRVSFLRGDHKFLSEAFSHESTKFLLLKDLGPLTVNPSKLAYVSTKDITTLFPTNPYSTTEEEQLKSFNPSQQTPSLVFLGLDERTPTIKLHDRHPGHSIFAIDITPRPPYEEAASAIATQFTSQGQAFIPNRMHLTLDAADAAIYAQARHVLDWHSRNPFCATCGARTLAVHAGWKRACPPRHIGPDGSTVVERAACGTRVGVSNLSFPRTDAVIICAVVSVDGARVLLGRQARWPKNMYSTLAGFLEPGEGVEEAVRREVWEESGVRVGRVVVHSTQPWPYPANIMIGAVGQAASKEGEEVDLGNDPELEDAKWWSVEDIREALRVGTRGLGPSDSTGAQYKGGLALPPRTAIANQLMEAVVNGGFLSGVTRI